MNASIALNLSCGIVVLWKLLLEANVSIALNLSVVCYHKRSVFGDSLFGNDFVTSRL